MHMKHNIYIYTHIYVYTYIHKFFLLVEYATLLTERVFEARRFEADSGTVIPLVAKEIILLAIGVCSDTDDFVVASAKRSKYIKHIYIHIHIYIYI